VDDARVVVEVSEPAGCPLGDHHPRRPVHRRVRSSSWTWN
jgi:hypothetical protein